MFSWEGEIWLLRTMLGTFSYLKYLAPAVAEPALRVIAYMLGSYITIFDHEVELVSEAFHSLGLEVG
jgi:hypothetical protein